MSDEAAPVVAAPAGTTPDAPVPVAVEVAKVENVVLTYVRAHAVAASSVSAVAGFLLGLLF